MVFNTRFVIQNNVSTKLRISQIVKNVKCIQYILHRRPTQCECYVNEHFIQFHFNLIFCLQFIFFLKPLNDLNDQINEHNIGALTSNH